MMNALLLLGTAESDLQLLLRTGIVLGVMIVFIVLHVLYKSGHWKGIERGQKEGREFGKGHAGTLHHLDSGQMYAALSPAVSVKKGDVCRYYLMLASANGEVFCVEVSGSLPTTSFFRVEQYQGSDGKYVRELRPCMAGQMEGE